MGRLPLAQGHVIRSQKDPGAITPVLPRLLIFFYRFIYMLLSSPRGRMPMSHTAENSSRWATSKLMDDGIGKRANSFVRRSFRAGKRERRGNLSMCHIDRVASLRRLLIITEKWSAETIFSRSVNTDKLQKIFFFSCTRDDYATNVEDFCLEWSWRKPCENRKKKRKHPRVFKEKRTTETTELYSEVITSCERMQNIRAQDDTALYERRS